MINTDKDALLCDLAETYHIYDYRSQSCQMIAAFSCGLRNDSRIKMKISKTDITMEEMLLSALVDNTKLLAWLQSSDGANGTNRPKSLLNALLNKDSDEREIITFASGEEFDEEWKRLTGKEE